MIERASPKISIRMGTLVNAYDIEGPMQGKCLKAIVPIGE